MPVTLPHDGLEVRRNPELAARLEDICRKHALAGCVLVSFQNDGRIATQFVADGPKDTPWFSALDHLSKEILRAMDDGTFKPPVETR